MQYSQFGQGEYLYELASSLCPHSRTVVDIGAHTPHKLSNSRCFLERGYNGCLIEANPKYCAEWEDFIGANNVNAKVLNQLVRYSSDSLDLLFSEDFALDDIGVLLLDIDGSEYMLIEGMQKYRPKLICVEYDNSYPLNIEYVPTSPGHGRKYQASSLSMFQLMKSKDYLYLNSFFQDHIFIEKGLFDSIATDSSVNLIAGDLHFYRNAPMHLFSYDRVLLNQADDDSPAGHAGIKFFASKVRNLVSNGQLKEAKQYFSHLELVFRSYSDIVKSQKSPSYFSQYQKSMFDFLDKYNSLFYAS